MAGNTTDTNSLRLIQTPTTITLLSWPLVQEGLYAWSMAVAMFAIALGAGYLSGSSAMGTLVGVALALSAWRLWIPVRFGLSSKGVSRKWILRRQIPWSEFETYQVRRRGVLLLSESADNPLIAFRSVYLPWNQQQEEVLDLLDYFLDSPRNSHPPGTTRTYQPRMDKSE